MSKEERHMEKQEIALSLLRSTRSALIIIDVQNDFCHPDGATGRMGSSLDAVPAMMDGIHVATRIAHENSVPVIFIKTEHRADTDTDAWLSRNNGTASSICRENTWGTESYDILPLEHDSVVTKCRYSAFQGTRLETILHRYGIETLLLCGIATNICVETTARVGYMMDYNVMVLADCCAAYSPQEHDMTIFNISHYFGYAISCDILKQGLVRKDRTSQR